MSLSCIALRTPLSAAGYPHSVNFKDGKFRNSEPAFQPGFKKGIAMFWRFLTDKAPDSRPLHEIKVMTLAPDALKSASDKSLWRLGHSTILLKLEGKFWLTDPVFAERASPVGFAGPKRFHIPPISAADLPEIKAVILSHDHYDHLDRDAIIALDPKVARFITPLGVGERLIAWGIPASKVQQLDWWQETQIGDLRLIATPAKHFSGRFIGDRDRTLWVSWVLIAPGVKLYFSGDSGYFDGFREIGERFGPFDLTMVENGAYDRDWPGVHMTPEESMQAALDLKGNALLPIHNGTFDLALHSWTDPFERILAQSDAKNVKVLIPRIGERVNIPEPARSVTWWR